MEADIVEELNDLRRDPQGFADKVAKYKDYFDDGEKILRIPGVLHGIKTEEGPAPYIEAVDFLNKTIPTYELTPSKGLFAIASDILKIIQKDPNNLGDIDIDPIIEKYGEFSGDFHRSVQFGGTSGEHIIVDLFVGDGDKSRSERQALLNENLKKVGVASGRHDKYRFINIIVACTQFDNKSGNDDYEL